MVAIKHYLHHLMIRILYMLLVQIYVIQLQEIGL